jgi:hypothetical protein
MSHLAHTPRAHPLRTPLTAGMGWRLGLAPALVSPSSSAHAPNGRGGGADKGGGGKEGGGRTASTQASKGGKQGRKEGRAVTDHSTCYKDSMRAVERHLSTACPLRASMHARAHLKGD